MGIRLQSRSKDLGSRWWLWSPSRLWAVREGTPVPFCAHAFLKVIARNTLLGRNRSMGLSWNRNLRCRLLRSPWSCWCSEQVVQRLKYSMLLLIVELIIPGPHGIISLVINKMGLFCVVYKDNIVVARIRAMGLGSTGCLNEHLGLAQLPLNQYQQSLGFILAASLWRNSHSLPCIREKKHVSRLLEISVAGKKEIAGGNGFRR